MDSQKIFGAILIIALITGAILLITRKPITAPAYSITMTNPGRINPTSPPVSPSGNPKAKHYVNTKEWEITYNSDGLPVKIVKHVHAEIG